MTNDERTKTLVSKINLALRQEPGPVYINEVDESNVKQIIHIFYNEYTFGNHFMLAYLDTWQHFLYADIVELLQQLAQTTNDPLSIEPFLTFFYSCVKIDLIRVYAGMEVKDKALQQFILKDFASRPGQLFIAQDDFLHKLKRYQLDPARLKAIRQRWIAQGATKAEKINLTPARVEGGAVLYHVQCPAPQSWTWVQQLNNIAVNP